MKNVGSFDASIRIVLGIAALYFGYVAVDAVTQGVLYLAALILIWTGWTGNCFIYSLLGMNTSEPEMKHEVRIAPEKPAKKVVKKKTKKKSAKKKPKKKAKKTKKKSTKKKKSKK